MTDFEVVWRGDGKTPVVSVPDFKGKEIHVGDVVETPPDASDPVVGPVSALWREWPFGQSMVLIGHGQLKISKKSEEVLKLRDGE